MDILDIFLVMWTGGLSVAFWYHVKHDCAELSRLIKHLEKQDKRVMDVMDRIEVTLTTLTPS